MATNLDLIFIVILLNKLVTANVSIYTFCDHRQQQKSAKHVNEKIDESSQIMLFWLPVWKNISFDDYIKHVS